MSAREADQHAQHTHVAEILSIESRICLVIDTRRICQLSFHILNVPFLYRLGIPCELEAHSELCPQQLYNELTWG